MKKTLAFLKKIQRNNNTEWMQAHREEYLEARKEFEFLVQEIIVRLSQWEPRFEFLEPKDCIFRFNRDIRFSNNKNPYKENFAAFFGIGGKKSPLPGYYISVSPKEIFVGGGLWQPEPDRLTKLRRYLSENGEELEAIVSARAFRKTYGELSDEDTLKRVPRGYSPEHPHAEFLKLKSIVASKDLTQAEALDKKFGERIDKILKELKPLNAFLEEALKS